MKNLKEQIKMISEQEQGQLESLLKRISEGDISRRGIESELNLRIKMIKKIQEISKNLD
jgi:hypothetical protein